MKSLALIDNPVITIKLKTALILIVALVCFLVSLGFFLLSWLRVRGQSRQDRAAETESAKEDAGPVAEKPALALPVEGAAISSAAIESKLETMGDQLSQVLGCVAELSNEVKAITASIRNEQQEKIEDQRRLQLEEERQRTAELERNERNRTALRNTLRNRLDELFRQSEMLQVALITKELLDDLTENSTEKVELAKQLRAYLELATKAEDLRLKLAASDPASEPQLHDSQIESESDSFERSLAGLDSEHRAVWFTGLLEESGRYPSLQDKADDLKRLLKLEEVQIQTGSVPRDLADLEVVSADGRGKRPIISEVLENGYRLTDTGTVLKRPKVRVHFEV